MDSETTAALIGASVGGGGAIVAQVVGEVFARGSERRRLQWDQSQRFVDLKRELFARYLGLHSSFWRMLAGPQSERRVGHAGTLVDAYLQHVEEAASTLQELLLIAPEMAGPCDRLNDLRGAAFEVALHIDDPTWLANAAAAMQGDPPLVRYKEGIRTCAAEMTGNLGTG